MKIWRDDRLVERIRTACSKPGKRFVAPQDHSVIERIRAKPNTPFQWEPICEEKELKRRLKFVSKKLARFPTSKYAQCRADCARAALFSSGDRRIARVIEATARLNGDLNAAIRETGIDPHSHTSAVVLTMKFFRGTSSTQESLATLCNRKTKRAHEARSTAPVLP